MVGLFENFTFFSLLFLTSHKHWWLKFAYIYAHVCSSCTHSIDTLTYAHTCIHTKAFFCFLPFIPPHHLFSVMTAFMMFCSPANSLFSDEVCIHHSLESFAGLSLFATVTHRTTVEVDVTCSFAFEIVTFLWMQVWSSDKRGIKGKCVGDHSNTGKCP